MPFKNWVVAQQIIPHQSISSKELVIGETYNEEISKGGYKAICPTTLIKISLYRRVTKCYDAPKLVGSSTAALRTSESQGGLTSQVVGATRGVA